VNDAKPSTLRVLSWRGGWGTALRAAVSDPFQARTGIAIEHDEQVGLGLPDALEAALGRREAPPVDVVWSHSLPALRMADRGSCTELDAAAVPNLAALHPRARPRESTLVFPYVVYYVLVYRDALFPDAPPASWGVLLEPRFARKIALYPGGNGFFAVAQRLGGGALGDIPERMDACWKFFERLAPQLGALDYSVGTMQDSFRHGELDLAFRALANALAFRAAGLPVSWTAPAEGIPDTTDALWVPAGLTPERAHWAKRYVDFALSPAVQSAWCEALGSMPMHRAARLPSVFNGAAMPKDPADRNGVLHIDDAVRCRLEPDWAARFEAIFRDL
jgi:putative spermidine/putrescine transport system substrate-binding protein